MAIEGMEQLLSEHRFFQGVNEDFRMLVTGCAKNVVFEPGQYLFHESDTVSEIFFVRHGHVALQITAPGRGSMTFETVGPGEVIGFSWLVPPYRWTFDARAVELTRAICVNAKCLRDKCEADHSLGYEMMKRFTPVLEERLHAARIQLLDLYGKRG